MTKADQICIDGAGHSSIFTGVRIRIGYENMPHHLLPGAALDIGAYNQRAEIRKPRVKGHIWRSGELSDAPEIGTSHLEVDSALNAANHVDASRRANPNIPY